MTEVNRTDSCISFEGNGKLANMVRDNSFRQYFKVIVKDENESIKVLATRCTYDKAYKLVSDFLK